MHLSRLLNLRTSRALDPPPPGSVATAIHPSRPTSMFHQHFLDAPNGISNNVGTGTEPPNLRMLLVRRGHFCHRLSTLLTVRRQQGALRCQTDGGGYFLFPSRIRVKKQVFQRHHGPFQPQLAFNNKQQTFEHHFQRRTRFSNIIQHLSTA